MGAKPNDWIGLLPGLTQKKIATLRALGVETIPEIPDDFKLNDKQARAKTVVKSGRLEISSELKRELAILGPPASYLDFETISSVIPIYAGTKPRQQIPFQWSVHTVDAAENMTHGEYLADGYTDPRRDVAETLIEELGPSDWPILVYHQSTEIGILKKLATEFPDLETPLMEIIERIRDLLPVVKGHIFHPDFFSLSSLNSSTYSIKNVLPILVPELSYSDLEGVASGQNASWQFEYIISGEAGADEAEKQRGELLEYCKLDTLAMVEIHNRLRERVI